MATWKLVAKAVKYTIQLPAEVKFTADTYECSECHNRVNNRNGLPNVCQWCREEMDHELVQ